MKNVYTVILAILLTIPIPSRLMAGDVDILQMVDSSYDEAMAGRLAQAIQIADDP